jgi:cobalt-zinc-cadmium efflux system outer membrane protein
MSSATQAAVVLIVGAALAANHAAAGSAGGARVAPGPVDGTPVDSLVQIALLRSPSLTALRERSLAAEERIRSRSALPDPMIEFKLQDEDFPRWTVGDTPMSMTTVELSQTIPFPGQRSARRRTAEGESRVARADLDLLVRRVVTQVRDLYGRIYALDAEWEALETTHRLLEVAVQSSAARYETGQEEQDALLNAQLALSRIEERQDDLRAERADLVAALNELLDLPGDHALGRVREIPPISPPPSPWEDLALEHSADVAARRLAVDVAAARVAEKRTELWPELAAGAGYGYRGPLDPVVTLRLGLQIPLWAGQNLKPEIRAAEHELEMARADLRETEATVRAQSARLQARWARAQSQIRRYREEILPRSQAALDAAEAAYAADRGSLAVVITALRMWLEARSDLARREAERYGVWADIAALTAAAPVVPWESQQKEE